MRVTGIIPARMGSQRFPGKPLAKIRGLTMLEHVYRRAKLSPTLDDVRVATCDDEIRDAAEGFGARVVMTSDRHTRCSDRVAEAARSIDTEIVINIQGDEPLLHPAVLDEVARPFFDDGSIVCTTIIGEILDESDFESRNVVKIVRSLAGDILYFSREPIPSRGQEGTAAWFKQAGIYAFTRDFLVKFGSLPEGSLESAESVDLLRVLEHGFRVRGVLSNYPTLGVDTPDDLTRAERLMGEDEHFARYASTS